MVNMPVELKARPSNRLALPPKGSIDTNYTKPFLEEIWTDFVPNKILAFFLKDSF